MSSKVSASSSVGQDLPNGHWYSAHSVALVRKEAGEVGRVREEDMWLRVYMCVCVCVMQRRQPTTSLFNERFPVWLWCGDHQRSIAILNVCVYIFRMQKRTHIHTYTLMHSHTIMAKPEIFIVENFEFVKCKIIIWTELVFGNALKNFSLVFSMLYRCMSVCYVYDLEHYLYVFSLWMKCSVWKPEIILNSKAEGNSY